MPVVLCKICKTKNDYPPGKLHDLTCGSCGEIFWSERFKDLLWSNWTRPISKVPFFIFIALVGMSFFDWLWPAAPLGSIMAAAAWLIRPSPHFLARGGRAALMPLLAGVVFACATTIFVNKFAGDPQSSAYRWETQSIRLARFIEPVAAPDTITLWIGLGILLLVGGILRRWELARRAFVAQSLLAWAYLSLTGYLSFSFFSNDAVRHSADSVIDRRQGDFLQAKLNFQDWAERDYHVALVVDGVKQTITDNPSTKAQLGRLAKSLPDSLNVAEITRLANNWVKTNLSLNPPSAPKAVDTPFIYIPYIPKPSYPSYLSEASSNPLVSGEFPKPNRLPTIANLEEMEVITGRLASEVEPLSASVEVQTTTLRTLLSDALSTGLERAKLLPSRELAKQLTQRFIDMVTEKIPVNNVLGRLPSLQDVQGNLSTRLRSWVIRANQQFPSLVRKNSPSPRTSYDQFNTGLYSDTQQLERDYRRSLDLKAGRKLSLEEFEERLEQNKKTDGFCSVCGLPCDICPYCR